MHRSKKLAKERKRKEKQRATRCTHTPQSSAADKNCTVLCVYLAFSLLFVLCCAFEGRSRWNGM